MRKEAEWTEDFHPKVNAGGGGEQNHVAVFNYLMKNWREDEARFFSEVHSDSTIGSWNPVVTEDIQISY